MKSTDSQCYTMNIATALYDYFFPTAPAPAPAPAPVRVRVEVCFSRHNEIYGLSLEDVDRMTLGHIHEWRPMISAHAAETYDAIQSENAALILEAMDRRETALRLPSTT